LEGYNCRFWFQFQIVKSELELGLILERIFGTLELELGFWFFKISEPELGSQFFKNQIQGF
jgi:hypothetical protein